jgi:hypothetical protein
LEATATLISPKILPKAGFPFFKTINIPYRKISGETDYYA